MRSSGKFFLLMLFMLLSLNSAESDEIENIIVYGSAPLSGSTMIYIIWMAPMYRSGEQGGGGYGGGGSSIVVAPNNPYNSETGAKCSSDEEIRRNHANQDIGMLTLAQRSALRPGQVVVVQYNSGQRESWIIAAPLSSNPTGSNPPIPGSCK